jgi:hypothetical protein
MFRGILQDLGEPLRALGLKAFEDPAPDLFELLKCRREIGSGTQAATKVRPGPKGTWKVGNRSKVGA